MKTGYWEANHFANQVLMVYTEENGDPYYCIQNTNDISKIEYIEVDLETREDESNGNFTIVVNEVSYKDGKRRDASGNRVRFFTVDNFQKIFKYSIKF